MQGNNIQGTLKSSKTFVNFKNLAFIFLIVVNFMKFYEKFDACDFEKLGIAELCTV